MPSTRCCLLRLTLVSYARYKLTIKPTDIRKCCAGAETGVELADMLSERMGLITNGTAKSEARRNKYVMGETIRAAGIRAVKQLRASTWREIDAFLSEWKPDPFKVVVKPMDSAGSDDVTLCHSLADVQKAFGNIMGKTNGLGLVNQAVLVQEYLEGLEYVVDTVSRDGVHKVAALWVYDRRPANGADFVAHGQRLLHADDEHCPALVTYMKKVLDALGIRHGPTHGEVKWFKGEPVLVEVGARCHGGDGLWLDLEDECFGGNQAKRAVDAYLFPDDFKAMPATPSNRLAYGAAKWLIVSHKEGIFRGVDPAAIAEICAMESYRSHQIFVEVDGPIKKTQTCFTWGGAVIMAHKNEAALNRDYQRYVTTATILSVRRWPHFSLSRAFMCVMFGSAGWRNWNGLRYFALTMPLLPLRVYSSGTRPWAWSTPSPLGRSLPRCYLRKDTKSSRSTVPTWSN